MPRGIRFIRRIKLKRELILLSLILAGTLYLILVPVEQAGSGVDLCLVKALTHRSCPGCGMTRAFSCVFHGEISRAIHYNPLVIVVFPLMLYLVLRKIIELYLYVKKKE